MGQGTDQARCLRFAKEFQDDFLKKNATSLGLEEDQLLYADPDRDVLVHVVRDDMGMMFCSMDIVYDPDWDDERLLQLTAENMGLSREEAYHRLRRADLIDPL